MEKRTEEAIEKSKNTFDQFLTNVQLKLHLTSVEAKENWHELEKQLTIVRQDLNRFSEKMEQETDEAKLQGHLALMNAKERWESVKDDLEDWSRSVSQEAEQGFDHARLKAALAKLEARDLIDQSEYEKKFHAMESSAKDEWYRFLTHFDEGLTNFINHFPLR